MKNKFGGASLIGHKYLYKGHNNYSKMSLISIFFIRIIFVLFCISIILAYISFPVRATETPEDHSSGVIETSETSEDIQTTPSRTILLDEYPTNAPWIDGTAYVLYDAQSKTFLIGSDCDTPLPPASTTKVLTVLLALEHLDLDGTITITENMYNTIPQGYVRLPLVEGEVFPVIDAIYASMLISANDACSALAVEMGGSIEGFADMMNDKARELGCLHSNFVNPYGFADADHLTSVRDMVLIMEAALEHDIFREIATSSSYTIGPTNTFPDNRTINNGNRFIATTTYAYEHYIGGKTGFTNMSGHTIVAAAERDGRILIAAIFGASHSEIRYENLITLFNYGFSNYTTVAIDHNEHNELANDVCAQINSIIETHGFVIFDSSLELESYITTTSERAAGGYSTRIDLAGAVVDPELDVQNLTFPLIRQYSDGQIYVIGTLNVSVVCEAIDEEERGVLLGTDDSQTDIFVIITRIAIIMILFVVVAIAILIYVQRQKRRKMIKNRRKPRVL